MEKFQIKSYLKVRDNDSSCLIRTLPAIGKITVSESKIVFENLLVVLVSMESG
ncbi:hypothetical protein DOK78_002032 [Enterococcus sp. DIV2402]|uniref:Uncharacterized protein n=1 Tax=Candidatus Enterococcus lowellii TaxID=2230877 RepID=A0ABZ2STE4_9ENTE